MLRRSLASLTILSSLLTPSISLAALNAPMDVFRALARGMNPQKYSMELHGSAEGAFIALWAKGTHEGMRSADMRGNGTLTLDIVQPVEGINVRLRAEYRYMEKTLFLKPTIEGAVQDAMARMNGMFTTKKWMMMDLAMLTDEIVAQESALKMIAETLNGQGVDMSAADLDTILTDTVNSVFALARNGGEYSLTLKPDAANQGTHALMVAVAKAQGLSRQDLAAALRAVEQDPMMAQFRDVLKNVNLHIRVRANAKEEPTYYKAYLGAKYMGVEAVLQGTIEKLWAPLKIQRPTDTMAPEELKEFFESMGGSMSGLDMFDDAFDVFEEDISWESPALPDGESWDTEEGSMDSLWGEEISTGAPCTSDSAEGLIALRKGQSCGRQTRSRRHLDR